MNAVFRTRVAAFCGPPRPWKPARSPSDVRPARHDGCASLDTVHLNGTRHEDVVRAAAERHDDHSVSKGDLKRLAYVTSAGADPWLSV